MAIKLSRPTSQAGLTAVAKVLDDVFEMKAPATMFRVGFMNDLVRSDQLILLAGTEDEPLGAIVALRGRDHVEMPDMVVAPEHQGQGVGRALFGGLTDWAIAEGYREIRWSVSPSNTGGVAAYLSYGARIVGWLDNAYGVASDAFYTGSTDRFRGSWRLEGWPDDTSSQLVGVDQHQQLRELIRDGWHITSRTDAAYRLVLPAVEPTAT